MLENRSFDHMLGYLDHGGLTPLSERDANPLDPSRPDAEQVGAFPLSSYTDVRADPGHGFEDVMWQLSAREGPWGPPYQLNNSGFVSNYASRLATKGRAPEEARDIMGCYTPEQVPIISKLAREFAVCSRWHCSAPTETWPNRFFAHSGHSFGSVENDVELHEGETIFERLSAADVSWRVYHGDIPQVAAYRRLWDPFRDHFDFLFEFFDDAEDGSLPAYSFIEPRHFTRWGESQHPTQRVWRGERLIKRVYEALARNPDVWRSVLFLVTYDEHGGFFDREAPPQAAPPRAGEKDPLHGFGFDLLGPRVPAVVVSPFLERHTVDHQVRDHTTILHTVRDAFGIPDPLSDRDAASEPLQPLLTLSDPREPPELPPAPAEVRELAGEDTVWADPSRWADGVDPSGDIRLNDFQRSLVELKLALDAVDAAPGAGRELADASAGPPFRSEEDIERFVDDFAARHLPPGAVERRRAARDEH